MAFRSSSNLAAASAANAAVPVPTGAAIGDIAVVGIYMESAATVTPPSGFTLKSSLQTSVATRGRLDVFWKRLTAADSGTYSFTFTSTFRAAVCGLWSGRVASGDPFDGTVGTAESTTTVSTLNVSTSPTGSNGDAVGFWTNFNGGAGFTPNASYTEQQDLSVITMDTRDAVASGTTGNVTATATVSDFEKAFLGVLAVASSGTTGTVAVTQAANTSTASGQLGYSGTSARTQAAQTSSATGTVVNPVTGTSAVTQANQTASASGQLGYSGTSAQTQANQTASASGIFTAGGSFAGSVAVTQANQTAAAAGQLGYSGTAARTQANNTSTASGILRYSGTSGAAEALDVSTAAGLVVIPITGTVAALQANQTAPPQGSSQGWSRSAPRPQEPAPDRPHRARRRRLPLPVQVPLVWHPHHPGP
jgi:hypothetical protein